jgi:hypothetical protein
MIKLQITKYREFTEEETNIRKQEARRNNRYGIDNFADMTPTGRDMYVENKMEVEITDEQFEAIRKAVLENF